MSPYPPSLWMSQVEVPSRRPRLDGDIDADVAIVGAGFTGLWTAYHLLKLLPGLRIAVLEAAAVGFGASGRNGGWCLADLAADRARWVRIAGERGADRMDEAIRQAVDSIAATIDGERIDCDWARGGTLVLARNPAQVERLRSNPRPHSVWLDGADARALCNASGVLGGQHSPLDGVLHPAKLVLGLADVCERLGARIFEDTTVDTVDTGRVTTESGTVRATDVVVTTEAYTARMRGMKRAIAPLYSRMVATARLPPDILDEIGLTTRPGFSDGRFRVIYGQRTADDRIAFGATASSYRFRSRIDAGAELDRRSLDLTVRTLLDLFPVLEGQTITHRWGGVLGAPRNWLPTVTMDHRTRIHRAGGYVGEGVAASHLAGQCIAHSLAGDGHEYTTLPWVRRSSRNWPVEPLRWVGINAASGLFRMADRREEATGRPARQAELAWKVFRR